MSELLEASRQVLRLWDNPQDLGTEVYTAAYERLREVVEVEELRRRAGRSEDTARAKAESLGFLTGNINQSDRWFNDGQTPEERLGR